MKALFIRAEWDDEAEVSVATSDDVPGLVAEADTVEALLAKLRVLIPELLEINGCPNDGEVPFERVYTPLRCGLSACCLTHNRKSPGYAGVAASVGCVPRTMVRIAHPTQ